MDVSEEVGQLGQQDTAAQDKQTKIFCVKSTQEKTGKGEKLHKCTFNKGGN